MPRVTSHSVWPSATVPPVATGAGVDAGAGAAPVVGAAAGPSDNALDSAAPIGGAIPGQSPSALIRSSGVIGLSGVSGGASMEIFFLNTLLGVENQSASLENTSDENTLDALPQLASTGAINSSDSIVFRRDFPCPTMNSIPAQ